MVESEDGKIIRMGTQRPDGEGQKQAFEVSVLTRSYFELIVNLLQNQDKKIVPSFVYK